MRYHHIKENQKSNQIQEILNTKYNGDLIKLKEAEKDYLVQNGLYKLSNPKKPLVLSSLSHNYIAMDIVENTTSLIKSENPLLSSSLNQLSIKKIMNQKPSDILNIARNKDIVFKPMEEKNELQKLFYVLNNITNGVNFNVVSLTHDRNKGIINYNTRQYDSIYGSTMQYGWITLNTNKQFNFTEKYQGKIKDFVDNAMIYDFSMMYGITKIYARCTCRNYIESANTKKSGGNFICSHLMWYYTFLPFWLYYALEH
jgi:hypothetical protein